uniref:Uncharacterized protein n=1 Tax=Manihot esculenta TaxID=3983 RepID=A0A2C9V209_MANES
MEPEVSDVCPSQVVSGYQQQRDWYETGLLKRWKWSDVSQKVAHRWWWLRVVDRREVVAWHVGCCPRWMRVRDSRRVARREMARNERRQWKGVDLAHGWWRTSAMERWWHDLVKHAGCDLRVRWASRPAEMERCWRRLVLAGCDR